MAKLIANQRFTQTNPHRRIYGPICPFTGKLRRSPIGSVTYLFIDNMNAMTNICLHCGTLLTEPHSDHNVRPTRKYCDDRCKMRYHRTKTNELASRAFSLPNQPMSVETIYKFKPIPWERGLFVKPIQFSQCVWGEELGLTNTHYFVAAADWDERLVGLNVLYELLTFIESFNELQGSTCKNSFRADQQDDTGDNWCTFLAQYAYELPLLEARLPQHLPLLSVFLKPYQTQIRQWIRAMTVTARFFVYENHRRVDRFNVAFDDSFLTEMKRAQRQVVSWWFDLETSIHEL